MFELFHFSLAGAGGNDDVDDVDDVTRWLLVECDHLSSRMFCLRKIVIQLGFNYKRLERFGLEWATKNSKFYFPNNNNYMVIFEGNYSLILI